MKRAEQAAAVNADVAAFSELSAQLGRGAVHEMPLDVLEQLEQLDGQGDDELEGAASPLPRKKRKSRSTYSARTITECRRRGWIAGNVERRIPFPKPQGTTIDLFGVIDIIAVDLSAPVGQRTIGIQATSGGTGGSHSPHRAKILAEPRARQWIEAGNRLELWSWAKQGGRGARKRWTLRVEVFTAESWSSANRASGYVPGDGPSEDRL